MPVTGEGHSADDAAGVYNAKVFSSLPHCRRWTFAMVLGLWVLPFASFAQSASPARDSSQVPGEPSTNGTLPRVSPSAPVHSFWDRTNVLLFCGVAVFRGLDYASTRNFQARGRTEILLPDDVVNNSAGFAGLEAAGAATSVGLSYLFHRTGHHTMERWLSIGHIGVTGFGVARNYSLKTKRPEVNPPQ